MSEFVKRECESGLKALIIMRDTVRACWRLACKHEEIDPSSRFIVFSKDNPVVPYYDRARQQFDQMQTDYKHLGYRLSMKDGRATLEYKHLLDKAT